MKTYQVRIVIVMTIFFVIAGSIGICSKEVALLAIIVQLLCSILILLARIYGKVANSIEKEERKEYWHKKLSGKE